MSKDTSSSEDICPVDPSTREAWLKANPKAQSPFHPKSTSSTINQTLPEPVPSKPSSSIFSRLFWASSSQSKRPQAPPPNPDLSIEREISSIPRTSKTSSSNIPSQHAPANNEIESGSSATGKWIYPSEKMFFEAMKRKGHATDENDMKTIVPIHNAVNERAWKEIKEWERPWEEKEQEGTPPKCYPPGPRLHTFTGLGTNALSPRARFKSLVGYTTPFDRHDWTIERCPSGRQVEYIIDFYAGSGESGRGGRPGMLNFYLDVRPKLNSWDGWKMRGARWLGVV